MYSPSVFFRISAIVAHGFNASRIFVPASILLDLVFPAGTSGYPAFSASGRRSACHWQNKNFPLV
ncbi:hypothetical protein SAMN05216404_104114 [Nitrosospira multiformis]|uniref:Uncharacterized protein n=1 Tax=Nitrosospira multiformis TaxID=1231 RepID=A0A1H8G796_9PROT|nr:hypothetical protein SAMN05216404_104114 [Nitrosospira multiformis]